MGGMAPLPPLDILATADRLQWPCRDDECLAVICAMDDEWRAMNSKE